MIDTTEKRARRHKMLDEARVLTDKATTEKRDLTAEERANWDKAWKDAETLKTEIADDERKNDIERELALGELRSQEEQRTREEEHTETTVSMGDYRATAEYRSAFAARMFSNRALNAEEQRALSAGTGTEGGYQYASEQFVAELIRNVTDATFLRQIARVWPPLAQADAMSAPTLTGMAAAVWTTELGTASRDSTMAFGRRRLTPHPLAKEIVVSKVLLRKVAAAEQLVREELARVAAEAMENGYLTGTGVQQPLGVFVASADGIDTDRDVTCTATTKPDFDALKAAKYAIKQVYWPRLNWVMHRSVMEPIAKIKDGEGRYIFQDAVAMGEPDRLLGFPLRLSEFAPSTLTAAKYVAMLGDFFSGYWIVDSQDIEIARAEELYIRTNQDLFIMRQASDGMPVKSECFARVKLAAA